MSIAIGLAALTAIATTAGGALALRSRDRLHLTLGLSAGLLLGLVGFDLLPEVFAASEATTGGVRTVSIAIIVGFLILHFAEQFFGSHEPAESDYGHDHSHSFHLVRTKLVGTHLAGTLGAIAMGGHIFLDGVALGVAFKVSNKLGVAVFFALVTHAFSDGLNTVSLLVKNGVWSARTKWLLVVDLLARVGGASLGTFIIFSDASIAIYLALFSGFLIYLATSHILPEAHSRHPSRLTMAATVIGVLIMWLVVAVLG